MIPPKLSNKNSRLYLALIFRLILVYKNSLFFDWLKSLRRPSQPIPRLISRQSWCFSSDSVLYPIRRGKDSIQANLYENIINCFLHQEYSIELALRCFLRSKFLLKDTLGIKCVYIYSFTLKRCKILCSENVFKNTLCIKSLSGFSLKRF